MNTTSEQVLQDPISPESKNGSINITEDEINGDRRYTGACKWFNVLKGYGFIVLDDSDEDVFVHQSELKMPGFRSLEEGERVAFNIRLRPGTNRRGKEACEVRSASSCFNCIKVGPEDTNKSLIGSSIRPLGNKRDKLIRCFKCGKFGTHLAQRCKKVEITKKNYYKYERNINLYYLGTKKTATEEDKSDKSSST
uniref:CSD_1 domain-containing protein n=1 Tax=Heterorhabditis bacteriophora TaxID=37862 RepID=A0A1I7XQ73_HETBA